MSSSDWKASDAETDRLRVPTNFARLCAKYKKHKKKRRLSVTDGLFLFRAISITRSCIWLSQAYTGINLNLLNEKHNIITWIVEWLFMYGCDFFFTSYIAPWNHNTYNGLLFPFGWSPPRDGKFHPTSFQDTRGIPFRINCNLWPVTLPCEGPSG